MTAVAPKGRDFIVLSSSEWDAAMAWAGDMASVVSNLRPAMTANVRQRVQSAVTVDELWEKLDIRFGTRSHGERTRLLCELVRTDMAEGEDAMAFFDRMDDIRDRLALAGMTFSDPDYASILLIALPDVFEPSIQTLNVSAADDLSPSLVRSTIVNAVKSQQERQAGALCVTAAAAAAKPSTGS